MVKLGGPCFSMEARGSFGKAITFAKVGKTNYAKRHFAPANPRSPAQTVTRLNTKFVCQIWQYLNSTIRNTWSTHPDAERLSLYHAYMIANQRRWAIGLPPAIQYPFGESMSTFFYFTSDKVYGREHRITFSLDNPSPIPILLQISAGSASNFVPEKSNTIFFKYPFIDIGGGWVNVTANIVVDTYEPTWIKARAISANGSASIWHSFNRTVYW